MSAAGKPLANGAVQADGMPRVLQVDAARRSADPRMRTMANILQLVHVLVPVDLAYFYAVDPHLEKYVAAPIVALGATAVRVDPDRQIARYRARFARHDPFAPRRVPAGRRVVTVQDIEPAQRGHLPAAMTEPVTPRAEVYLRDAGRIVAAISLTRAPAEPDLSVSEVAILRASHRVFEDAYTLACRVGEPRSLPPAVLTPRERDVAELLAVGASNTEISQALHVTLNTAKVHVQHVLAKLGVANRRQAMLLLNAASRG